ncbi:hypothetical protein CLOM_g17546 [Closterium sp. NIES-68]|nr:hypothetical protein CLOM_g17546 [Closterium sp. NIES-68]
MRLHGGAMGVRPAAAVVQQQVRVDPVGVQLPGQRAAGHGVHQVLVEAARLHHPPLRPRLLQSHPPKQGGGVRGRLVFAQPAAGIACELGVDDRVEPWSGWLGGTLVSGLAVPRYNLRLVAVVAPYLVRYSNADWAFRQYGLKPGDGSRYVVWLDDMDAQWASVLQHVDLTVFMSGHWFLDKQGAEAVRSTVYVANNKVVRMSGMAAYRTAMRNVKRFVAVEQKYRGVPMWLTYSPSHYSRGNPPHAAAPHPSRRSESKQWQPMTSQQPSGGWR